MNRNTIIGIVVVVLIIAVVGGFFFFRNNSGSGKSLSNSKASPTPVQLHAAVSDVTINGTEFAYSPQTIPAVATKRLTITFKNNGKTPHNIVFKDFNVSTKTLQPGQSETIEVTPPKPGMYQFTSTVGSDATKGMVGILMVQPANTDNIPSAQPTSAPAAN